MSRSKPHPLLSLLFSSFLGLGGAAAEVEAEVEADRARPAPTPASAPAPASSSSSSPVALDETLAEDPEARVHPRETSRLRRFLARRRRAMRG